MNLSSIKTFLKYALLLTPAAVLSGLIVVLALGTWVTAILRDPVKFEDAPVPVQKMTRSMYLWNTRVIWQTLKECVEFDIETLYRPRPGSCHFNNVEFATVMHFDDYGIRHTASPVAADHNGHPLPRLIIVGDSHAMGWGVGDDQTFASVLAREHGYPTVNLGVSSYGTVRELRRLERRLELSTDDVIVIQYCDNDFEENEHFLTQGAIGPYRPEDLMNLVSYRPTPVELLPVTGKLMRNLSRAVTSKVSSWVNRASPSAANRGLDSHPTNTLLGVLRLFPILLGHRVFVVAINGQGNRTHLSMGQDAFDAAGIPLIVPALTKDDVLAIDPHMNPRGHRAVAAEIAAAVAAMPIGRD